MTVWLPWASQQGAIKYRTGPEPAGGSDAGGGMGWPQMVVGLLPAAGSAGWLVAGAESGAAGAGGCCAAAERAASSTVPKANTRNPLNIASIRTDVFSNRRHSTGH